LTGIFCLRGITDTMVYHNFTHDTSSYGPARASEHLWKHCRREQPSPPSTPCLPTAPGGDISTTARGLRGCTAPALWLHSRRPPGHACMVSTAVAYSGYLPGLDFDRYHVHGQGHDGGVVVAASDGSNLTTPAPHLSRPMWTATERAPISRRTVIRVTNFSNSFGSIFIK
jgi:hypothetical protein